MTNKCPTCGSTATIDDGSACAQCGCDRDANERLALTPCSRLFRVWVTYDTVIYAEDEKAAKQLVKYGMGEIDDMPVSVIAMPIQSRDGLPAGWNTACLPWGNAPENITIGEILNANDQSPDAGATEMKS